MLAVYGQNGHAVLQGEAVDNRARHYQRFLVGEGYGLTRLDGFHCGAQA